MSLTKFCIYHQPRTGSTMIWGILGNHPQIICEGEIFHPEMYKEFYSNYKTSKEYMEAEYYPKIQDNKVFGFKLQGFQAREVMPPGFDPEGEILDVRDYLRQENYKIIRPHRLNKLEQFVSQLVAKQKERWQRWVELPDGTKIENDPEFEVVPIKVSEEKFKEWYDWETTMERKIEEEIEGLDALRVSYERLLADRESQVKRMLDFLGVDYVPHLEAKTMKARGKTLRDWVVNYDEACAIHDKYASPHEVEYRIEHQ